MRGRKKGKANKPNRYWSKEEKLRIVTRVFKHEESISQISKEEKINPGQLYNWISKYKNDGEKGLINKRKIGVPYNGLHLKKELSEIEQLQYENMKLRVELERAKKGYLVKGDGQNKRYISIDKKNLK